ncbi:ThuA domain-containing protein [Hyphomonas sp.]|uniref:ThuA domain-containing protein n=1 Tax=Hyphomonas sp. TaxID=87 RepID=UPI0039190243
MPAAPISPLRIWLAAALLLIAAACTAPPAPSATTEPAAAPPHILVFSHTTGYRHASIEPGIAALRGLAAEAGYAFTASEDPAVFTAEGLAPFDALILLSATTQPQDPSSEWLDETGRAALKGFVHSGRGIAGIHAAADSHYHWPWYRRMIGAAFARHPPGTPEARIILLKPGDVTVRALPPSFARVDEWYYFSDLDAANLQIVAAFDPASIGEPDTSLQPISWRHEFEGARIFYTGMGHTAESFTDPLFLTHLSAGLGWVLTGEE